MGEILRHLSVAIAFAVAMCIAGCGGRARPLDWGSYDVLHDHVRGPTLLFGGVTLTNAEYWALLRMGERWFRQTTFGGERTLTDVAGFFSATLEIPCDPPQTGCSQSVSALPYVMQSIDQLDGVSGNLFTGNGGPDGPGLTSDLVVRVPVGTTLYGIVVPAELHTGLDVEAGSAWPIGVVPVVASAADQSLPYLIDPSSLGVGPAPQEKLRVGLTCAICHYSLDIDWDGKPDLRSAKYRPGDHAFNARQRMPGSPYQSFQSWGIGNQDVHFGWLFALAKNPLLGAWVISGPVDANNPEAARRWVNWVKDNYRNNREDVMRAVVQGMLVQPRGYADDSPNAVHDPNQLPSLYTRFNWPYNYDGALLNASDRNNGVWTGALDFTGLIGLAKDRADATLPWNPRSVYSDLPAETMADMMVRYSPAVAHDPSQLRALKDDILGVSDGVPGLLRNDSVVVMAGFQNALPKSLLRHPQNIAHDRVRTPHDYPGDAPLRGGAMALLGTRVRTPPEVLADPEVQAILNNHPELNREELLTDAISLMLDWNEPPPNVSQLLARAAALVPRGYEIFKREGCDDCHRGPFLTDNRIVRFSPHRSDEYGIAVPSTAGWSAPRGPATETAAYRAIGTRELQMFVAPSYDPATGLATDEGSLLNGLFGTNKRVGYKTITLRHLWGSAPYLHDGGVGVTLNSGSAAPGDDLQRLLSRPATDKIYGMGGILTGWEVDPESRIRANAALSLQALVLRSERDEVIRQNRRRLVPVPSTTNEPRAALSMELLGVEGIGHEFYLDDVPGGDDVTALVAFLLALDDRPGDLPPVSP